VSLFFNFLNVLMRGNLPPLGCACAIVEHDGCYLVVEQGEKVVFPGGFIRWKEHPVQTAMREGYEETGLFLEIGDILNVYPSATARSDDMSTLTVAYEAKVVGGTLRGTGEGRPCWIEERRLRERLGSYYGGMLDDYLTYRLRHKVAAKQVSA
jgi:ADP-ribose pyrophosphatase YjhB (NUDIX family)